MFTLVKMTENPTVDVFNREPWYKWPELGVVKSKLADIDIQVGDGTLVVGDVPFYGEALQDFAGVVGYPTDFVSKLSLPLQQQIIAERMKASRDQELSLVAAPDANGRRRIVRVVPAWRGICHPAEVMHKAYSLLSSVFGEVTTTVSYNGAEYRVDMMTTYQEQIDTSVVGDILKLGIQLIYKPGCEIVVRLLIIRLVCTNGMTAAKQEFGWSSRALGAPAEQLTWITVGVADAIEAFMGIVEQARLMSTIKVDDPEKALFERARAMQIPQRFDARLLEAYKTEPGSTEWNLLNAFTALASHGGLQPKNAFAIAENAGDWVQGFDIVSARMPRPIANRVGAQIIEVGEF